jgi:hypothetical protein
VAGAAPFAFCRSKQHAANQYQAAAEDHDAHALSSATRAILEDSGCCQTHAQRDEDDQPNRIFALHFGTLQMPFLLETTHYGFVAALH